MKKLLNFSRNVSLILIFFLVVCVQAVAQKGRIQLLIYPSDSTIVRLDTQLVEPLRTYELDTGMHTIRAWAPNRELIVRDYRVLENNTTHAKFAIPYSKAYRNFSRKMFFYKVDKATFRYVIPAAYVGYSALTWIRIRNLNDQIEDHLSDARAFEAQYYNSGDQIEIETARDRYNETREDYEEDLKRYNRARVQQVFLLTGGLALVALSEYFSFKLKPPVYKDKVMLSMNYVPSSFMAANSGGVMLNLNMRF